MENSVATSRFYDNGMVLLKLDVLYDKGIRRFPHRSFRLPVDSLTLLKWIYLHAGFVKRIIKCRGIKCLLANLPLLANRLE